MDAASADHASPDAAADAGAPASDAGGDLIVLEDATSDLFILEEAPVESSALDADAGGPAPVVETLAQGLFTPQALAVDTANVYILETTTATDDSGARGEIRRCPLAGCGASAPTMVVPMVTDADSMALSGTTLFWADGYARIRSCDVTTVPCVAATFLDVAVDGGGLSFPSQLWINGSRLYWFIQPGTDHLIQTCPITGCTAGYPKTVLDGAAGTALPGVSTSGLVIDGSFAYVAQFQSAPILRYTMTDAETANPASEAALAIAPFGTHDLDLDGTTLRWAESANGQVAACTAPGCASVVGAVPGRATPYAVRHDATYVYGVDRGSSSSAGVLWRAH